MFSIYQTPSLPLRSSHTKSPDEGKSAKLCAFSVLHGLIQSAVIYIWDSNLTFPHSAFVSLNIITPVYLPGIS